MVTAINVVIKEDVFLIRINSLDFEETSIEVLVDFIRHDNVLVDVLVDIEVHREEGKDDADTTVNVEILLNLINFRIHPVSTDVVYQIDVIEAS